MLGIVVPKPSRMVNMIEKSSTKATFALMEESLRTLFVWIVYQNPAAKGEEEKAVNMVANLYGYYMKHIELLPQQFLKMMEKNGGTKEQIVCDYIAGMTDTYAIKKFEEYFVPESWKF